MLIKELSRKCNMSVKELLKTPTGCICYIVDLLKKDLCVDEVADKLRGLDIPYNPMLEAINDKSLIEKVISDYENIENADMVYNLC